ncbi:MAG TPA: ankyrin repeat domain-containing protein [Verrucomicrobiae bacterium]|nr:ankyrin repeat domain-containing protein [Verrucomicrobiae bacterium]
MKTHAMLVGHPLREGRLNSDRCRWQVLILIIFASLAVGCGDPQESARKELAKLGKDFSPTVFIESIANGDKVAVKLFLAAGIDVNQPDKDGVTALMNATMKGDTNLVERLLEKGANVNAQSSQGMTALTVALMSSNEDLVKALLAKGANPNLAMTTTTGETGGITPLMTAVMGGRVETVKLLLAKGADVNARDEKGLTAADYAKAQPNPDILKLLQEMGAPAVTETQLAALLDQFSKDLRATALGSMRNGETSDACRKLIADRLSTFKDQELFTTNQLLEARVSAFNAVRSAIEGFALGTITSEMEEARQKAKPFMEFRKELQADKRVQAQLLCSAAVKDDGGLAKWLLEQGADVNARSEAGFTPLMFAATKGSDATAQILLAAGADASLKGYLGMTPVMYAAANGNTKILKLLLAAKGDVSAKNEKGQTALMMAEAKNDAEAFTLLKDAGAKE